MQLTIALPLDSFLATLDRNDTSASMAQDPMSVDACIHQRIALQTKAQDLMGRIGSYNAPSPDDLAVQFIVDELTDGKDVGSLVSSWLSNDKKALLGMFLSSLEELGHDASFFKKMEGESKPATDWDDVVMRMCDKESIPPKDVFERMPRVVFQRGLPETGASFTQMPQSLRRP
ncbi:hypothetical protein QQX98_012351 [Neonectria punicea]|uniref:Uncharacterized protein n=1 Tax=Neonectria punicea TaxID=979145 RepID=A0ABR1GJ53_9HYPO